MSDAAPDDCVTAIPAWCFEQAEVLRRKVRDIGAEEAEAVLACALLDASRRTTQHAE